MNPENETTSNEITFTLDLHQDKISITDTTNYLNKFNRLIIT